MHAHIRSRAMIRRRHLRRDDTRSHPPRKPNRPRAQHQRGRDLLIDDASIDNLQPEPEFECAEPFRHQGAGDLPLPGSQSMLSKGSMPCFARGIWLNDQARRTACRRSREPEQSGEKACGRRVAVTDVETTDPVDD